MDLQPDSKTEISSGSFVGSASVERQGKVRPRKLSYYLAFISYSASPQRLSCPYLKR